MRKNFWKILAVFGILVFIIFICLLFGLRNKDKIVYTDETGPITSPVIERTDPYTGSTNPKVTVVYFGDFQNETGASIAQSLNKILEQYPDDVLLIWKDFPNESLHPEAVSAAIAARCAQDQKAFWLFYEMAFANQNQLGNDLYLAIAKDLELRENKFSRCLKRQKTKLIEAGYLQAMELGLTTAPTIFVNDLSYTGQIRETELRTIIRNLIEQ